jgi:hypothetical protein
MSLSAMRMKFDGLLKSLNGTSSAKFSTVLENGYEALVLASVMTEYTRVYGAISNLIHPTHPGFLKQKPGRFEIARSFKIEYTGGASFYFCTDVEIYGLEAFTTLTPRGGLFEVDVAVIGESHVGEILQMFNGYPGPQHLHSIYECKYGSYNKGQLRELLGLRRHVSMLRHDQRVFRSHSPSDLFSFEALNSDPVIPLHIARPRQLRFLNSSTANFYDLNQIVIN